MINFAILQVCDCLQ